MLEAKSSSLGGLNSNLGCVVPVAFHVITNGTQGNVTDQQIAEQIDEMNLDYSGSYGGYDTGYRFVLSSIDRTNNATWFTVVMDSNNQKRLEEALGVDPTHHLNIYTADIDALGWSSLPWGTPKATSTRASLSITSRCPVGTSRNSTWVARPRTRPAITSDCSTPSSEDAAEPNDFVADTPQEAEAASGCPPDNLDTCPSAGMDPIHDYLDYSDDPCYDGFTAGQDARMDQTIVAYRPSLLPQPVAVRAPVTIPELRPCRQRRIRRAVRPRWRSDSRHRGRSGCRSWTSPAARWHRWRTGSSRPDASSACSIRARARTASISRCCRLRALGSRDPWSLLAEGLNASHLRRSLRTR